MIASIIFCDGYRGSDSETKPGVYACAILKDNAKETDHIATVVQEALEAVSNEMKFDPPADDSLFVVKALNRIIERAGESDIDAYIAQRDTVWSIDNSLIYVVFIDDEGCLVQIVDASDAGYNFMTDTDIAYEAERETIPIIRTLTTDEMT